jgi:hypothetical protein
VYVRARKPVSLCFVQVVTVDPGFKYPVENHDSLFIGDVEATYLEGPVNDNAAAAEEDPDNEVCSAMSENVANWFVDAVCVLFAGCVQACR